LRQCFALPPPSTREAKGGCGGCPVLDLIPLPWRGAVGGVVQRVYCGRVNPAPTQSFGCNLCAGRPGVRPLHRVLVFCFVDGRPMVAPTILPIVRAFSCQPAPHLMRGG
ncbi:MAG: hypothetical protein FWB93_05625, partial [Oscillospiraceae bacterium]|nr:hypothetical protein [Oscillospiraceae bacterium]